MMIKIKQIDPENYEVNGKPLRKDMDGIWVSQGERLTENEIAAFYRHLNNQKLSFRNRLN